MEAVDPWQVTTGLLAMLLGLGSWVAKQHIRRIDRHDDELSDMSRCLTRLEASMLEKDDLRSMEARMMGTLTAQHATIMERVARVEKTADKAHERIDVIARQA